MSQYDELKRLAEASRVANHDERGPDEAFQEALHPEVVLALIAENERLSGCIAQRRAQAEQYDQALIQMAAERDQIKGENESLRDVLGIDPRHHVGKATIEGLKDSRDQFRAEIAGLKTGYQAYERVNAELKAENEALRKQLPLAEIIWCACGDGYPVNSHGAGFMDANGGVCANCDAAMGKGEQS